MSLFNITNIVKNSNESKYMYRGYAITINGAGLWSFPNDFSDNFWY